MIKANELRNMTADEIKMKVDSLRRNYTISGQKRKPDVSKNRTR
ncbi:MAG: hypothetical protein PHP46_05105 [Candidatus Omnitrophica bacterium]|nr:hypothetical protein [Candidatus Omnitrophota bacterium]